MEYYLKALKQYADFEGRARRKEYWMFFLFNVMFSILATILDSLIGLSLVSGLYSLVLLVPGIAAGVRRLHDIGKSGWWLLIAFIPLIGVIWLIVLLATDGQPGANQYGDNPKEVAGA